MDVGKGKRNKTIERERAEEKTLTQIRDGRIKDNIKIKTEGKKRKDIKIGKENKNKKEKERVRSCHRIFIGALHFNLKRKLE